MQNILTNSWIDRQVALEFGCRAFFSKACNSFLDLAIKTIGSPFVYVALQTNRLFSYTFSSLDPLQKRIQEIYKQAIHTGFRSKEAKEAEKGQNSFQSSCSLKGMQDFMYSLEHHLHSDDDSFFRFLGLGAALLKKEASNTSLLLKNPGKASPIFVKTLIEEYNLYEGFLRVGTGVRV